MEWLLFGIGLITLWVGTRGQVLRPTPTEAIKEKEENEHHSVEATTTNLYSQPLTEQKNLLAEDLLETRREERDIMEEPSSEMSLHTLENSTFLTNGNGIDDLNREELLPQADLLDDMNGGLGRENYPRIPNPYEDVGTDIQIDIDYHGVVDDPLAIHDETPNQLDMYEPFDHDY